MKRSAALALAMALTTTLLAGWVLLSGAAWAQKTALPPLDTAGDAAPRPWKRDPTWPQAIYRQRLRKRRARFDLQSAVIRSTVKSLWLIAPAADHVLPAM
jgi:hypothetical protein